MKQATKNIPPATIDAYLNALPEEQSIALEDLRKTITSIVPKAEEVISYQIPAFKYNGKLVAFAAFKDHCSFFPLNSTLIKELSEDLKDYKTSPGTIQFTVDKPLPSALVKKIVEARMKENEAILLAKKEKKAAIKKGSSTKSSDAEKVDEYMSKLEHPLKAEIEALRTIIKGANKKISERIKWNAPSYYYKEDLVTFNHRAAKHVHLVFHHPSIVNIKSNRLEGDYKDRRMMYLTNVQEVKANKKELEYIMNELVKYIDNNNQ